MWNEIIRIQIVAIIRIMAPIDSTMAGTTILATPLKDSIAGLTTITLTTEMQEAFNALLKTGTWSCTLFFFLQPCGM